MANVYEAPELLAVGAVENIVLGVKVDEQVEIDLSKTQTSILDVD